MPVQVTSKFDEDPIKNERTWRLPFSHYKSMGNFSDVQGQQITDKSIVSGPIWPKFELVRDFMHVLVTCKYKKNQIKNNREKMETLFSPLSQWAISVAMEIKSFDPICPKTLCNLSPTPMMLQIKFDQHWPAGLRDIQVSSDL